MKGNKNVSSRMFRRVCLLVEGRGSRVTSRGSRVNGRGSRVNGRGSRVTSRGSKNSSQLLLNVVKSKLRVYLSFRFLFYFTLTPSGTMCFFSLYPVSWNKLTFVVLPGYTAVTCDQASLLFFHGEKVREKKVRTPDRRLTL